ACAAPPDVLTITVGDAGAGTGTVTSTPAGILCGATCAATYPAGTSVALTASPAIGSSFTGWSGGCSGTATCTLAGNAPVTVTATFAVASYPLTVATSGPGSVTSLPAGISCGSACSSTYPGGTLVTLTAVPSNNGAAFTGWSNRDCRTSGLTCT